MFREMRRKLQQLPQEECERILREGKTAVLALAGDDGYPYAVPVNYVYDGGKIYFHCAKTGHKLDALRRCEKVSVCVVDRDDVAPERLATDYMSVIVFGRVRELTESAEKRRAIELLAQKFAPDDSAEHRAAAIDGYWDSLCVLELRAEHLSGKESAALAEKLRISYDHYGFFMESHPKLRPVETNTAGVFLAGVCQGTKDIPNSVAQGSAAAAKVLSLFSRDKLQNDPQIAHVDIKRCVDCGKCIKCCPFGAIKEEAFRGQLKAKVIDTVCQGCGVCTSTCPQGAIQLSHATDNEILAEVNTLCQF